MQLGRLIIAIDYSEACLRRMMARTTGAPVLAVQSDLRLLPIRDGVMSAATCIEVYSTVRLPLTRPLPRAGRAGPCTRAQRSAVHLGLQLQRRVPALACHGQTTEHARVRTC